MGRHLAEVTALDMHKAGTAHLDQLATRADLAEFKAELETGMLKVAGGIVITNAGFVLAAVKFLPWRNRKATTWATSPDRGAVRAAAWNSTGSCMRRIAASSSRTAAGRFRGAEGRRESIAAMK